jgi:hypothetical protein
MIYTNAHIYPSKYHSYIDDAVKDKILNEYLGINEELSTGVFGFLTKRILLFY